MHTNEPVSLVSIVTGVRLLRDVREDPSVPSRPDVGERPPDPEVRGGDPGGGSGGGGSVRYTPCTRKHAHARARAHMKSDAQHGDFYRSTESSRTKEQSINRSEPTITPPPCAVSTATA